MNLFSGPRTARPLAAPADCPRLFEQLEPRQLLANTVVDVVTTQGTITFEMLNTAAPETVLNFMNYLLADRWDNTFVHRSVDNFVIQMGGFTFEDGGTPTHIPTFAPVINEFGNSNIERTVAMAKTGDQPNSATSEFFINLKDNAHSIDPNSGQDIGLDVQNGGFTVFARVINGWNVVLAIADLQTVNAGGAFTDLPVVNYTGGTVLEANLVRVTDVRIVSDPIPEFSAKGISSAVVRGAGALDGQTLFVTVNDQGRPIAFHQATPTSAWTVSDINLQSGGPVLVGQIHAWQDPKDGKFYAAAPTAAGLLLYQRSAAGFWKFRNLNDEIAGASLLPVSGSITVFTSTGDAASKDLITIAGLNAQGQIVIFSQSSKTANSGHFPWAFVNLHINDLVPNGQTTPSFVGPLTSYVTTWNGKNIAGLDAAGDVWAVWWAPGIANNRWRVDNLSDQTGAPPLTGGLSPYLTPWGGINLAGTDTSGNVLVTWWGGPGDTPDWKQNNFTQEFSGTPVAVGSLTSYVTPWGGLNVTGTRSDGLLVIYWWGGPGDTTLPIWKVTLLDSGALAGAAPIPVASRINGIASPTGQINLVGLAANGDVLRYNWKPGEAVWNMQNLTAVAVFF